MGKIIQSEYCVKYKQMLIRKKHFPVCLKLLLDVVHKKKEGDS